MCGARSVLGHVATDGRGRAARDSVHVREAYYKIKDSKQKLFYFISKSSKLVLFYCHFRCRKVKGRNFKRQHAKVETKNKSRFFKVPKSEFRQKSEESHP